LFAVEYINRWLSTALVYGDYCACTYGRTPQEQACSIHRTYCNTNPVHCHFPHNYSGPVDQILNIVGIGMLVPMPVLWLCDWIMIGLNIFALPAAAITHTLAQLWETYIEVIGLNRIIGVRLPVALALAVVINIIYVLLAQFFIR